MQSEFFGLHWTHCNCGCLLSLTDWCSYISETLELAVSYYNWHTLISRAAWFKHWLTFSYNKHDREHRKLKRCNQLQNNAVNSQLYRSVREGSFFPHNQSLVDDRRWLQKALATCKQTSLILAYQPVNCKGSLMLQISCGIVAQWSCKILSYPHYSSKSIDLISFFLLGSSRQECRPLEHEWRFSTMRIKKNALEHSALSQGSWSTTWSTKTAPCA